MNSNFRGKAPAVYLAQVEGLGMMTTQTDVGPTARPFAFDAIRLAVAGAAAASKDFAHRIHEQRAVTIAEVANRNSDAIIV